MKRIIISLLVVATLALSLPIIANAQTITEQICQYVQQKEQVKKARCLIYQRNCVVAIQTEKFTSKSQYEQFKENLQKELAEKFQLDNIVITRSPKAMHRIEAISALPQEKIDEAIERFIQKELEHLPNIPSLQPRIDY